MKFYQRYCTYGCPAVLLRSGIRFPILFEYHHRMTTRTTWKRSTKRRSPRALRRSPPPFIGHRAPESCPEVCSPRPPTTTCWPLSTNIHTYIHGLLSYLVSILFAFVPKRSVFLLLFSTVNKLWCVPSIAVSLGFKISNCFIKRKLSWWGCGLVHTYIH